MNNKQQFYFKLHKTKKMIHTKEDFYNKVAADIKARYFPHVAYHRDDKNNAAATYTIELFNNGCLTYRTFIGRLAKHCNTNNATIHNMVEKHIISFGEYQYKPRRLYSESKCPIQDIEIANKLCKAVNNYDSLLAEMESWKKENFDNVDAANETIIDLQKRNDSLLSALKDLFFVAETFVEFNAEFPLTLGDKATIERAKAAIKQAEEL